MFQFQKFLLCLVLGFEVSSSWAFTTLQIQKSSSPFSTTSVSMADWEDSSASNSDQTGASGAGSSLEQLEFTIYPDGRVTETVRGVKGENCHKVTEPINEMLGKVVQTEPTEELYEQELVIDQTLTNTNSGDSWEGSSSW